MTSAAQRDRARADARRHRPTKTGDDAWLDDTMSDAEKKAERRRQDAITKKMANADAKAAAAEQRKLDDARREGKRDAQRKTPAKKAAAKKSSPASKAKRTAKRAPARARKITRQVRSARTGSVTGLVVGSLVLVALYVFLTNADAVGGFLGGIQRAFVWLADPHGVIPFKSETNAGAGDTVPGTANVNPGDPAWTQGQKGIEIQQRAAGQLTIAKAKEALRRQQQQQQGEHP